MASRKFQLRIMIAIVVAAAVVVADDVNQNDDEKSANADRLKLHVYYETLCPDSMRFMRDLNYAMLTMNWLPYTDLKFVPYGKVSQWTDPKTNITNLYCQHGRPECELNALHACIVEHNSIVQQVQIISCLMRGFSTDLDECANKLNIDVSLAKECKQNRTVLDILRKHGEATDLLDISYVPSITLDEEFNRWGQRSLLYNFFDRFCRKYKKKFNVTLPNCRI